MDPFGQGGQPSVSWHSWKLFFCPNAKGIPRKWTNVLWKGTILKRKNSLPTHHFSGANCLFSAEYLSSPFRVLHFLYPKKFRENLANGNQLGIKSGKTAKINDWTNRASSRKPFLDVQASMWDILIWFGNLSTIAARVMVNGSVPFQKCKYEGDIE